MIWQRKLKFGFAAAIVFLTVFGTWYYSVVPATDAVLAHYIRIKAHEYSSWSFDPPPSNVTFIRLLTHDASTSKYLELCSRIVEAIKEAKPRVVVIEAYSFLDISQIRQSLLKLWRSGIVVFAVPYGESKFVSHPFFHRINLEWGVLSARESSFESLRWPHWIAPIGFVDSKGGGEVTDVALSVLRKYHQYGQHVQAVREGNVVQFGDYSIPVFRNNMTFVGYQWLYPWHPWAFESASGLHGEYGDTLKYYGRKRDVEYGELSVSDIKERVREKIVIIPWQNSGQWETGRKLTAYASILHGTLDRRFLWPLEDWTPYLIALFVIVSAFIADRLRPFWTITVLAIVGILYIGLGIWLLNVHSTFLDIFYPTLALGLSIATFPALRLSFDRRVLIEEKRKFEAQERERLAEELRAARDTQMSLLPNKQPLLAGMDISGVCIPSAEVGGDFYDYVKFDREDRVGLVLADVSGKAMKAAITAVLTSGLIASEVRRLTRPSELLEGLNGPLVERTDKQSFVTMCAAVLDGKKKTLAHARAGSPKPLLARSGKVMQLETKGVRLPLGVQPKTKYQESVVKLKRGDVLLFYTDGVVEAMNEREELYGFERLEGVLKETAMLPAERIHDRIAADVKKFVGDRGETDDMTMVVVKVL
jgi:serine phosphatase RsbU (regulator of sigma subunit)